MEIISLIIQLISGAAGGTAVGKASPNFDLGPIGNAIAGAVGGGVGGQYFSVLCSGWRPTAQAGSISAALSGRSSRAVPAAVS